MKKIVPSHFLLRRGKILLLVLALLTVWSPPGSAQIELVKDIHDDIYPWGVPYQALQVDGALYVQSSTGLWRSDWSTSGTTFLKSVNVYRMFAVGNRLYFYGNDGVHGDELWTTDGTPNGTIMLKDVAPGAASGGPIRIHKDPLPVAFANNFLFFVATNSASGKELWRTDGTPAGTILLQDIAAGSASSNPGDLTVVNNLLYFTATTSENGKEVWRSNGYSSGTFLLRDIIRGPSSSNPTELTSFQAKLFFTASDGINGYELWSSDGSITGTGIFKDIRPGKLSSSPGDLTISSGSLFFHAATDVAGRELWKSNGTSAGTVMVEEIRPGENTSGPKFMTDVQGQLYFAFNDGVHGNEFWKSDGTAEGTSLAFELKPGSASGVDDRTHTVISAGSSIFIYRPDKLWGSDGTQAGTKLIMGIGDFYNTTASFYVNNGTLYVMNNQWLYTDAGESFTEYWLTKVENFNAKQVYQLGILGIEPEPAFTTTGIIFPANPNGEGAVLMRSNGTDTEPIFSNQQTIPDSNPSSFVELNGDVLFVATDSLNRRSLMKKDGSTGAIEFINDRIPLSLTRSGDVVFFNSNYNSGELWKTNGTAEGTELVRSNPGSAFFAEQLIDINGTLFFSAYDTEGVRRLWKTDGTTDGTTKIPVTHRSSEGHDPRELTLFNGKLYFQISGLSYASGLWETDGTVAGTKLVAASLRYPFSDAHSFTTVGDKLFFTASSPSTGLELYMYKATIAAPVEIRDLRKEDGYYQPNYEDIINLKAGGDRLYFQTTTNNSTWDYWTSDGSAAGTYRILRITNTTTSIRQLEYYQGKMYFIVSNTNGPTELWATAGTAEGTTKVATLPSAFSGAASTILNNVLYFSGAGHHLWRTDGTTCGTFEVASSSEPVVLVNNELYTDQNERILFAGYTPTVGAELFKLENSNAPGSPCQSVSATTQGEQILVEDGLGEDSKYISSSPNPFTNAFVLRINSPEDREFNASIISADGKTMLSKKIRSNTDYHIGQELRSGMFLLKVVVDKKIEVRRLIKTN